MLQREMELRERERERERERRFKCVKKVIQIVLYMHEHARIQRMGAGGPNLPGRTQCCRFTLAECWSGPLKITKLPSHNSMSGHN